MGHKLAPLYGSDGEQYLFDCPGCECSHWIRVKGREPCWGWNGSLDKPTITPSIRVQSANANGPTCCHSFIADGMIQYLGDCTHRLANQTVELPDQ